MAVPSVGMVWVAMLLTLEAAVKAATTLEPNTLTALCSKGSRRSPPGA